MSNNVCVVYAVRSALVTRSLATIEAGITKKKGKTPICMGVTKTATSLAVAPADQRVKLTASQ